MKSKGLGVSFGVKNCSAFGSIAIIECNAHKILLFYTFPLANDTGANISDIINSLQSKLGYSEGEVRTAIENLSNQGMIYSTIDEDHFDVAA